MVDHAKLVGFEAEVRKHAGNRWRELTQEERFIIHERFGECETKQMQDRMQDQSNLSARSGGAVQRGKEGGQGNKQQGLDAAGTAELFMCSVVRREGYALIASFFIITKHPPNNPTLSIHACV